MTEVSWNLLPPVVLGPASCCMLLPPPPLLGPAPSVLLPPVPAPCVPPPLLRSTIVSRTRHLADWVTCNVAAHSGGWDADGGGLLLMLSLLAGRQAGRLAYCWHQQAQHMGAHSQASPLPKAANQHPGAGLP